MNLEKGKFYYVQDISGQKPGLTDRELFPPFQAAATRNNVQVVYARTIPVLGRGPLAEFYAASSGTPAELQKTLSQAAKATGRDMAIRMAG